MVIVILIVGALDSIFKNQGKRLGELEIRRSTEAVETTELQRLIRILRKIQEICEELLSLGLWCGKLAKSKLIIIIMEN